MNRIRTGKTAAPTKHLDKKFGMKRIASKASRRASKKDRAETLSEQRS